MGDQVDINANIVPYSLADLRAFSFEVRSCYRRISPFILPSGRLNPGAEMISLTLPGSRGATYGRAFRYANAGFRTIVLSYITDVQGSFHMHRGSPNLTVRRIAANELDDLFEITSGYVVVVLCNYIVFCHNAPAPPPFHIINQLERIQSRPHLRMIFQH